MNFVTGLLLFCLLVLLVVGAPGKRLYEANIEEKLEQEEKEMRQVKRRGVASLSQQDYIERVRALTETAIQLHFNGVNN